MLPALRDIGQALAVTGANDTQLVVTLFILGMVFGEIFFGPISDAIGRKRAILAGLALFAFGAVVAMTAGTLEPLLAGRIIQAIGCAGPTIAPRAVLRPPSDGHALAPLSVLTAIVFLMIPLLAPATAPHAFGV